MNRKKNFTVTLLILLVSCSVYSKRYKPVLDYEKFLENDCSESQISIVNIDKVYILTPSETKSALIFYPGAKVDYRAYLPLMRKIAQNGMMCFLVKMPNDIAINKINAATSIIDNPEYSDIENWFIGGHSLGGAMSCVYASRFPEKINGVVLCAAYSTKNLTGTDLKVLSVYGTEDGVMNKKNYSRCFNNLPEQSVEIIIDGGNHAQFGYYGSQDKDNPATISAEEQWDITAKIVGEFCK